MRIAILDRTIVRTLIVLAVAQLIGWGSVGLLAIVGSQIAVDLKMSIAAVFAGNSVFYVVMGLWAPPLAKAFKAFGARRVMIMGTILAAPGSPRWLPHTGRCCILPHGLSLARPEARC